MMQITSTSFSPGERMPDHLVFCRPHATERVEMSDNKNPQLAWSDVPDGARSLVLLCIDPDAPTVGDDVNEDGRTISVDLERGDFHHWVMVDIPTSCVEIAEGSCSDGITAGGKTNPPGPVGSRQGVNDYTSWFTGDAEMGGDYIGYDGPCPPWNDLRLHHYCFRLFALNVERLDVDGAFTASDVLDAMNNHVLAQCEVVGTYSLNPDVFGGSSGD